MSVSPASSACHILKLPVELRTMIYDKLFPPDTISLYAVKGVLRPAGTNEYHPLRPFAGLLTTCKTLFTEASSVLFANKFRIVFRNDSEWEPCEENGCGFPNVFSSLHRVRELSLDIMLRPLLHWEKEKEEAWLGQLLAQIVAATSIRSLHMRFEVGDHYLRSQAHEDLAFNYVVSLFKDIRCKGNITATMGLSIGKYSLDTKGYYEMLASTGGTDITRQLYAATMRDSTDDRDEEVRRLEATHNKLQQKRVELKQFLKIKSHRGEDAASQLTDLLTEIQDLRIQEGEFQSSIARVEKRLSELEVEVERQVGDRWPRLEAA